LEKSSATQNMEQLSITTNKEQLDVAYVHAYLTNSYWAKGRTLEQVQTTIEHSFCFGMYLGTKQIGFARLVTDKVVFAYLMDVFIDEAHQGKGLGKLLMKAVLKHKELHNINKWLMKTKDAHAFYERLGFTRIVDSSRWMEK